MKAKIYYLALKIILQRKYSSSIGNQLDIFNILDITFWDIYKEAIKIWCAKGFKQCYYPIFIGLIIDYKKQVLITGIKPNMQCPICYILSKKRKSQKIIKVINPQVNLRTAQTLSK